MPDAPLPPLPPEGQPPWRTWFDELRRRVPVRPGIVVVAVLAVALAAVGVVLLRPAPPVTVATLPTAAPAPAEPAEPGEPAARSGGRPGEGEAVVVDVAGAVARPGLVRLRGGDRVADAVAAAGGATAEAETAGLNQARVVADGEQVRVPRAGEAPPPAPAGSAPGGNGSSRLAGPAAPVDLNRATLAELDTLPGVGPATATAILAWRDENGGFRRVDDLLEVPGIGPARLERLRPLVRV
jgi:competence protein ComEA